MLLEIVNKVEQCGAAWADLHKHVEDAEVEQGADHAQVRGHRPPLNIGNWSIKNRTWRSIEENSVELFYLSSILFNLFNIVY